MTISVWPVNAVSSSPLYAGRMLRQTQMASLAEMGDPLRPLGGLSGVRSGTPTTTVTATSTTWTCKPHAGILDVESAAEAGPYGYAVDANVTGAVTAANASNARVDLIYAKLSDPAESDGSTLPQVEILYVAGTAGAVPTAPPLPARSSPLAWINVPKAGGGSPTVTWKAWGVTPGSVEIPTWADLDAWTPGSDFGSPRPYQRATVINDPVASNNGEYAFVGGVWAPQWDALGKAPAAILFGTVPPERAHLIRYSGYAAVNTVASGDSSLTYPAPFPNGVISVHLQRYNFANFGVTSEILNTVQALDKCNFRIYGSTGSPLVSVSGVPYIYTAVGW